MSHFGVLVLVESDEIEEAVGVALNPFDENLEVDQYEEDCYCVGHEAHMDGIVAANEQTDFGGRLDIAREAFDDHRRRAAAATGGEHGFALDGPALALVEDPAARASLEAERDALDEQWKGIYNERDGIATVIKKAHPLYRKPNPKCDECGGTGRVVTTRNPQGHWDWWTIGGRWTGVLDPDYDPAVDPRNFAPCWLCNGTGQRTDMRVKDGCNACQGTGIARNHSNAAFAGDVMPVAALPEKLPFYALVTPDGQWHSRGRMGWFGMSADDMEQETWRAYLTTTLAEWPESTAVVVDCHV